MTIIDDSEIDYKKAYNDCVKYLSSKGLYVDFLQSMVKERKNGLKNEE